MADDELVNNNKKSLRSQVESNGNRNPFLMWSRFAELREYSNRFFGKNNS